MRLPIKEGVGHVMRAQRMRLRLSLGALSDNAASSHQASVVQRWLQGQAPLLLVARAKAKRMEGDQLREGGLGAR